LRILMLEFKFAPFVETLANVLLEVSESGISTAAPTAQVASCQIHANQSVAKGGISREEGLDKGLINIRVFNRMLNLMDEREGFSKLEHSRLQQTFRDFDRDKNGKIDPEELSSVIIWLGYVQDEKMLKMMLVRSKSKDPADETQAVDLETFFVMMRTQRLHEYKRTEEHFAGFDQDADGFLSMEELVRMFKFMGIELMPEALVDAVISTGVDPEKFTFDCMWKMLEYFRDRESFTNDEFQSIDEVFNMYDEKETGQISSRKVRQALRWLGFLLNPKDEAAQSVDWSHLVDGENGTLTVTEFRYLARRHQEADQKATRSVFRRVAGRAGAEPMRKEKLRKAVKKLNHAYLDDYTTWLRTNLPATWFSKSARLSFEDFRRLVDGCREKVCERLRANHGFTDVETAHLRISFVRYVREDGTVSAKAQGELFKSMIPTIEIDAEARNRLKNAMEFTNCASAALTWDAFLKVMRKREELEENYEDTLAPTVMKKLGISRYMSDHVFKIYQAFTRPGGEDMSLEHSDLRLLSQHRGELTPEHLQLFSTLVQEYSKEGGLRAAPGAVQFCDLVNTLSDPEFLQRTLQDRTDAERKARQSGGGAAQTVARRAA